MLTTKQIQKEIADQQNNLEQYDHYRDELGGSDEDTIADLVENADIDSIDFHVGYEQGFLHALNYLKRLSEQK